MRIAFRVTASAPVMTMLCMLVIVVAAFGLA
jgi:hypothetical protein